jgi:3-oxoacyl-[acyl-carrier-protein] synthase III
MNLVFHGKKIEGLLAILPANERLFVDEMDQFDFPRARSLKLKEVMGYDRHRIVDGAVCVSDLAVAGFEHLFAQGLLGRDDFDALILVTQSPDYLMPATSSVIQGRLGLKHDMFCMDINQGCAGFLIGLYQAFMLLEQPAIRRVALVNADVMSRKVSVRDRNSYPLIGDAASITLICRGEKDTPIHANLKMDGSRREALMIPAGGLREPSSPETRIPHADDEGNLRARDNLVMDGSAVFNFVQTEVPPMIDALLAAAQTNAAAVDAYLFHQPNRFMLQKLADKMQVPYAKMPSNVVEHFGNSSGVTIPLALTLNLRERVLGETLTTVLGGFGVGLTWSSMLLPLGPLAFCDMINYPQVS